MTPRRVPLLLAAMAITVSSSAPSFTISGERFIKDGQPFTIASAEIHYWRVLPADWAARLAAIRASGFNTVTTYVNWALHQPEPLPAPFDFDSPRINITAWLAAIADAGLLAIVRVGPYITAEVDFGGFPYWLSTVPGIELRTPNATYLSLVDAYWDELVPLLLPFEYARGGPIVDVQLEDDTDTLIPFGATEGYYAYLAAALRARGVTVLLNTLCGPTTPWSCQRAATNGTWLALEFNVDELPPADACAQMRQYRPSLDNPCMVATFGGTNFGFSNGADVYFNTSILWFRYGAVTTSYDYDAPISEAGDATPKAAALRDVFAAHDITPPPPGPLPPPVPRGDYGSVSLCECASLLAAEALPPAFEALFDTASVAEPGPMEPLGYGFGFIQYAANVSLPAGGATLAVGGLQDRALVLLDGTPQGVMGWTEAGSPLAVTLQPAAVGAGAGAFSRLDVLVENKGRCSGEVIDFSCARKGITAGPVTLDGAPLVPQGGGNWTVTLLPFSDAALPGIVAGLPWQSTQPLCGGVPQYAAASALAPESAAASAAAASATAAASSSGSNTPYASTSPAFYRGVLELPSDALPRASFLLVAGWGHGFAVVNGFNLGRVTPLGPQLTLFVPASVLRPGNNTVMLFESDLPAAATEAPAAAGTAASTGAAATGCRVVSFVSQPTWKPLPPP